jgi:hypothetical protein
MLHPLAQVSCYRGMLRLVAFQRRVLKLAIKLAGAPWAEPYFQQVLGTKAGHWFWERCKGAEWRDKSIVRFVMLAQPTW